MRKPKVGDVHVCGYGEHCVITELHDRVFESTASDGSPRFVLYSSAIELIDIVTGEHYGWIHQAWGMGVAILPPDIERADIK